MTRRFGLFLLLLALAGGAVQAESPPSPARRLEADYVVTWLGFPVYSSRIALAWDGERYRMRFRAEAEGLVRLAAHITVDWETIGRVAGGEARPERFEQANTFRRQTRRITLTYAEKAPPAVSVVPPESPGKRPPVPDALKAGTLDPLSATFAAIALAKDTTRCTYAAKVFEGLRRTDVRLEHAGTERTPVHRVAGFDREALVCRMHAKRLAGYEPKHFKQNPEPLPPATLWVAKHAPSGLWLPTQLRFESEFGPIYAHLTRIEMPAGGGE